MIAENLQSLVNEHLIENAVIRSQVSTGLSHIRTAIPDYVDNYLGVNSSRQLIDTIYHDERLAVSRSIFMDQVVNGNMTGLWTEYPSVAKELFTVFGGNGSSVTASPDDVESAPSAGHAPLLLNLSALGIFWLLDFLSRFFDWIFMMGLFFLTLYGCLSDEQGLLYYFSRVLDILDRDSGLRYPPVSHYLSNALQQAIHSALVTNVKLCLFHMALAWISFHMVGCSLVFIPAFLAGFLSLVPVVPPMLLCLPGAVWLYFRYAQGLTGALVALAFMLFHIGVSVIVDSGLQSEMHRNVDEDWKQRKGGDALLKPNSLLHGLAFWLGFVRLGVSGISLYY